MHLLHLMHLLLCHIWYDCACSRIVEVKVIRNAFIVMLMKTISSKMSYQIPMLCAGSSKLRRCW